MSETRYELKKESAEIKWKNRDELKPGCTTNGMWREPEVIKVFSDKEEALEELAKYQTKVEKFSGTVESFYMVTEYYVEENIYDEDGDFEEYVGIWEFSSWPDDFDADK